MTIHDFGIPFGVGVPAGRSVTDPTKYLTNNAVTNVVDYAAGIIINTGVNDAAPAIARALAAIAAGSPKKLYFPSGSYISSAGFAGIIGNNGFHGLHIAGDGNYASRILQRFNGDLFTMDSVLGLTVREIGFDGDYGVNTGRCFVLTGNCNQPRFDCDFVGYSDSHIRFGPDCGYNAHIATNHFSGAGQGDYRAIHVAGPDTTATPRTLVGMVANGYVQLDGALDTMISGSFATRYVVDNNCNETCIAASIWADQQNFLASIPITIGGHQTQIVGCRFANAIVLAAGSSGALVGNRQSGSPVGLTPLVDNSGGTWAVVHPAFGAAYHQVGLGQMTAVLGGEILLDEISASTIGNANITLIVDVHAPSQTVAVPLTANRVVTLSGVGARNGSRFEIVRTGGDTGGPWTLTIAGGTGASLLNNQSCIMKYNGSFWECRSKSTSL